MSVDTTKFLANTEKLFEALHVFQFSPALQPTKDHYGAHLELLDIQFNTAHLIQRLLHSVVDWVFAREAAKQIFEQAYGSAKDLSAASATLYNAARETVRLSQPQGQFGELLLCAFLQHLFQAAPLLRKQPVRTSDNHERFGADAIHYNGLSGHDLYLGESKCYKSSYQFPAAFEESISSMQNTLASFTEEIRKFVVGGFIEPELKPIAEQLISNKLPKLRIHPVSIVIYNETTKFDDNGATLKEQIRAAMLHQCTKIKPSTYASIDPLVLSRFTYIIMPVWKLDALLSDFVKAL